MTSSLTNICLILAAFLFLLLFLPLFHSKIATSNDQGATGYVIIIIGFLHLVILGLISAAYIAIGRQGGFQWVPGHGFVSTLFVSIGLISCVIISALSVMSRIAPGSIPEYVQVMARLAPVLIPAILIGTGFILNNHFLRDSIPLPVYKWTWLILNAVCLVAIIVLTISILTAHRSGFQESTRNYESEETIKNSRLTEIDSADVSTEMVRILEFTGGLYPPEVRQRASAKIKTDTTWQQDLLALMENDHALEVFSFLQSNEVDDKNLFLQPVLKGVESVAARIRHDIQGTSPSGFYSDMFNDEVERVLRTVEKFEGMGVDYLPAVKEMRTALDEPRGNSKVRFDCVKGLEEWIEKRK
jgi:hypothetical protein